MSAEELRQAADWLSSPTAPTLTTAMSEALADLLDDMADGFEHIEEMYADAEDAAERMMRGYIGAAEFARALSGGA